MLREAISMKAKLLFIAGISQVFFSRNPAIPEKQSRLAGFLTYLFVDQTLQKLDLVRQLGITGD